MQQNLLRETRLKANEGIETLHKDVQEVGKMLKSIVKFFVAFFLFLLFNACLDLFTKHTHLISLNSFRMLEEGLQVYINQNLLAFLSIVSENNLFAALMVAFTCVFATAVIVSTLAAATSDSESDNQVKDRKQFKQEGFSVSCVVAYKQKVCFLS